jgi:hypothetical protein
VTAATDDTRHELLPEEPDVSAPSPTPLPGPPLKMEFVRIREDRVRGSAGTAL